MDVPHAGMTLDGRYELTRELGSGGMGMVFEARHLRLHRPVAIKVLRPDFAAKSEFQIRFEREARASTLIESPHAVHVYDVATSREGFTYMVMELLDGNDLGAEAERGPIALPDLADWIIQACSALKEAHEHKIIHRDIKPANIFIAREEGRRIAKLLDFGISKFDEAITAAITKPVDGTLGTPTFMSPEQIRGRKLDARTDIWALGIVLYRLTAHRWPFSGANDRAYMAAVLADPPIPLEIVRPDLPYEFASVVMRAIEKKPEDRFSSASALAEALKPFGTGAAPLVSQRSPFGDAPVADTEREPQRIATARIVPSGDVEALAAARTMPATPIAPTPSALAVEPRATPASRRPFRWVSAAALLAAASGFIGYLVATTNPSPITTTRAPENAPEPAEPVAPPTASATAAPIEDKPVPPPPATGVAASSVTKPAVSVRRRPAAAVATTERAPAPPPPSSASATLPDFL